NEWQFVFEGNFLSSKVLFSCNRKPSSGFYRSIISYYNYLFPTHITNFYNHSTTRATSVFWIHSFTLKSSDFDAVSVFVKQIINTLTSGHFAFCMKFSNSFFASSFAYFGKPVA